MFISHANEDKEAVVLPLADALRRAGLRVWLDRQELSLGDSLREKIDEGLGQSRFGVVILSKAFLAKRWPKQELNGLLALEEDGRKVILPVWHEITKSELADHSPLVADRLAANTADGLTKAAKQILSVVLEASDSPSVSAPTPARLLNALLGEKARSDRIRSFVAAHAQRICNGGRQGPADCIVADLRLGKAVVPFTLVTWFYTTQTVALTFIALGDASGSLVDGRGQVANDVAKCLATLDGALKANLKSKRLPPLIKKAKVRFAAVYLIRLRAKKSKGRMLCYMHGGGTN